MYKTVKYNIYNTQKICKRILYVYIVQYIHCSQANYSNIFNLTVLFSVLNHFFILYEVKFPVQFYFLRHFLCSKKTYSILKINTNF